MPGKLWRFIGLREQRVNHGLCQGLETADPVCIRRENMHGSEAGNILGFRYLASLLFAPVFSEG